MATVTFNWTNWDTTNTWENLADAGNNANITYARDATDVAAKFTETTKNTTATEYARKSGAGNTWASIFNISENSTVSQVRITTWKKKVVTNTKLTSHSVTIKFIDDSATTVATMISGSAMAITTDASYQTKGASSLVSVGEGYTSGSTSVRLSLEYSIVVANSSGNSAIDTRFDDITVEATYVLTFGLTVNGATQAQTAGNVALTYYPPFVIGNTTQTQTADNVALTQHQILVVNTATQTQTSDNIVLTQHQILIVDNATQTQTSDNIVLTQNQILVVNTATQTQTVDNVALTQNQILVVNTATQTQTSDNIALTQHQVLTVSNATQAQTSDNITVTYNSGTATLTVNNSTQTQISDFTRTFTDGYGGDVETFCDNGLIPDQPNWNTGVNQGYYIGTTTYKAIMRFTLETIPAGATCNSATIYLVNSSSGDNKTLTLYHIATANGDWIEGTGDNETALTGESCWNYKIYNTVAWAGSAGLSTSGTDYSSSALGTLSWLSSDSAGTSKNTTLTASVVQGWFGQASNNGILIVGDANTWNWVLALSDHATTAYRPKLVVEYIVPLNLTQNYSLTVNNATQVQTSDNVILSAHYAITVANATQLQTSDKVTLSAHYVLSSVKDATQAQTSDNITVTYNTGVVTLTVQNATQLQTADIVALTQDYLLTINNATQLQTSDNVVLIQHQVLGINDSTQLQTSIKVDLIQYTTGVLTIQNATQLQIANTVALTQDYVLTISNVTQLQTSQTVNLTQHQVLAINNAVQSQTASSFFIDNFDRGNDGLGSNWTTMAGTNSPIILNNKVIVPINAALAAAYINIQSFGNNQFSQATFPSLQNPVNYGPGVGVRFADSRGYILWYGNSASQVSLWRQDDASTWVQIGSNSSTLTISPTDIWKIEASGSAIAGYQNGTQVVQTFDNTYSSGRPGIWLYYNFNELDDFTCGYVSNVDLTQHQVLAVNNATQLQSSGNVVLTQHQILSVDDCYSTSQVDGAGSVGVIDVTIGANEDDGGWRGDADSFYQNHYNNIDVGYVWSGMFRGFFRFDNLTISGTIITAHVTLQAYSTQTLDGSVIYAVDASDPAAPTTKAEAEGATRTTEHVHWANGTQTINVDYDTPELKNIIQELVDSYTFNGTQALIIYIEDDGASNPYIQVKSYNMDTVNCARLHVEYSSGGLTLTQNYGLTVQDSGQLQTSDNISLFAHYSLTINNVIQVQISDNIILTQHYILVVATSTQLQITDNINLLQGGEIGVQDAIQLQTSGILVLTQHQILVVNNTTQLQISENIPLTQHQILIIQNTSQSQTSGNVILTQHQILVINNATQLQTSQTVALTQHQILVVNNAIQLQTTTALDVIPSGAIELQSATQLQTSQTVVLTQHHVLTINNTSQLQISNIVTLTQHHILTTNNTSQLQTSQIIALVQHYILIINSSIQLQTSPILILVQDYLLIINSVSQLQTSNNVTLIVTTLGVLMQMMHYRRLRSK